MKDDQERRNASARNAGEPSGVSGSLEQESLETRTVSGATEQDLTNVVGDPGIAVPVGQETLETQTVARTQTDLTDVIEEESVLRVPLKEERLEARTVPTQLGSVLFHKRIEEVPSVEDVELHQDDVSVERVESNELVDAREDPWYEGDTLVIPVYQEKIVTETRLMLRELLRVNRKERIEHVMVEGTVRREVVDVEPVVNDEQTVADVEPISSDDR